MKSPIYDLQKIAVWDLVGQPANPNVMNGKTYCALIQSILNTGYCLNVVGAINENYDKNLKMDNYEKLCMCIQGDENDQRSAVGSTFSFATQVSNENKRKYFKYELVDGSQRASVVRLGTKYFMEDKYSDGKIKRWESGDVPTSPSKEALEYIAWKEDFSLPVAFLQGKTEAEKMSSTVLLNTSRGTHTLDSMSEIVYELINVAGMSKEWVAQHLFLDVEAIDRMNQIGGLKSAYNNVDNCDLGWSPENDVKYQNNERSYLNKEAAKYIVDYYN